jgi:hypothetical protein
MMIIMSDNSSRFTKILYKLYNTPGEFKGGTISFVTVSTGKEKYSELETEAARAWAKE